MGRKRLPLLCRKCGENDLGKLSIPHCKRICKQCESIYTTQRQKGNIRYYNRQRIWRENNPTYQYTHKYRMTVQQREDMYRQQNGCCYICGLKKRLLIDHDHTTFVVRRLLCSACNIALGLFKDNPDILRDAANYIENFRE